MANRISKVVTKTGDDGSTGLGDGSRVTKSSLRIESIGDIDELNSLLGLLKAQELEEPMVIELRKIQNMLFNIGSELAVPGATFIASKNVESLEEMIEDYNRELPPLKEFILPGGNQAASICHLARAVCRRCERHLFHLGESESVNQCITTYINRLSDLLFILARLLARKDGAKEIYWQKDG